MQKKEALMYMTHLTSGKISLNQEQETIRSSEYYPVIIYNCYILHLLIKIES